MTVTEFHRMTAAALSAEPNDIVLKGLAKQAYELSDMVGWATGIIDKDRRVSEAFIQLQAQAQSKHKATGDENIATLHDALGDLMAAILTHDEDLRPSTTAVDENFDI